MLIFKKSPLTIVKWPARIPFRFGLLRAIPAAERPKMTRKEIKITPRDVL
jgi:hypothetical protein